MMTSDERVKNKQGIIAAQNGENIHPHYSFFASKDSLKCIRAL